jgi:tRNA(adenine34) deaminase
MINPFTDEYFMKKALQEAEMAFDKGEILGLLLSSMIE